MFIKNINEIDRQAWLKQILTAWPFAYGYALMGLAYFKLCSNKRAEDLACFGWHCVAVRRS